MYITQRNNIIQYYTIFNVFFTPSPPQPKKRGINFFGWKKMYLPKSSIKIILKIQ